MKPMGHGCQEKSRESYDTWILHDYITGDWQGPGKRECGIQIATPTNYRREARDNEQV